MELIHKHCKFEGSDIRQPDNIQVFNKSIWVSMKL